MREFKFFQKGTTDMMDDEVRATASFNADTPEGYMNRRMLYHTNPDLYGRLRHPNNEMEQYFYERGLREQRDLINTDNQRGFFQPTTVTKVNPKWWMKIKMGLQEMSIFFKSSPYGIMLLWALSTIGVILFISKLLNAW
jgi:hypothetical protein